MNEAAAAASWQLGHSKGISCLNPLTLDAFKSALSFFSSLHTNHKLKQGGLKGITV